MRVHRTFSCYLVCLSLLLASCLALSPSISAETDPWLEWASIAWRYYQPGVGVDVNTGLHYGTLDWHYITDWDTGNYIVAILDAYDLKLIADTGTWGASDRLDKVLQYLETRELRASDGLPYWAYDSTTRMPATNLPRLVTDRADTGRLLVALHVLKERRPALASRVDGILARMRTAYGTFVSGGVVSYGFYGYYFALGFNAFGFNVSVSLNEMGRLSSGAHVDVYGQQLPLTKILTEPFLNGILEVPDLVGPTFMEYAYRVLEAQRGRWSATGFLTGWSEGAVDVPGYYAYEWILMANGTMWRIEGPDPNDPNYATNLPVLFTKVAFGLHAIFGTDYTRRMVDALLGKVDTQYGFREGIREKTGEIIGNQNWPFQDKTNSIILAAARYATIRSSTSESSVVTSTSTSEIPEFYSPLLLALVALLFADLILRKRGIKGRRRESM